MKNTIKEDNNRNVFKTEYINDNSLIEYSIEDKKVCIGIRFIENHSIEEHLLKILDIDDYVDNIGSNVRLSDDKSTIAIFETIENGYRLEKVYDVENHNDIETEFMDIMYDKKFPSIPLDNHLIYKKKK